MAFGANWDRRLDRRNDYDNLTANRLFNVNHNSMIDERNVVAYDGAIDLMGLQPPLGIHHLLSASTWGNERNGNELFPFM